MATFTVPGKNETPALKEEANKKLDKPEEAKPKNDGPRKVKEPFLRKHTIFSWMKREPAPEIKELQEPLLFLIKENGYTDILENIKSGEFIIQTPKGEKSIWLTPEKLLAVNYGSNTYRGWIAYENCMTPYPEDPIYEAELQRRIHQKIAINYKDLNEAALITAKTKMWLLIIGAIVLGAFLFLSSDFGKQMMAQWLGSALQTAATNATNTSNITHVTVSAITT